MVRTREFVLYSGEVTTVTSFNDKGKFDVLSEHANFISLIKSKIIVKEKNGETKEIKLDNGVMRVIGNKISVYLGIRNEV